MPALSVPDRVWGGGGPPLQLPSPVPSWITYSSSLDPGAGRLPFSPPRDRLCRVLHGAAHPPCHLRRLLEVGGTLGGVRRWGVASPDLDAVASSSVPACHALSGS